jgi:hypothetical protein
MAVKGHNRYNIDKDGAEFRAGMQALEKAAGMFRA